MFSVVELAAKSIQQELQRRKSQEDAWNNSAIDLVRASDVSSVLCTCARLCTLAFKNSLFVSWCTGTIKSTKAPQPAFICCPEASGKVVQQIVRTTAL